eukprot:595594-Prymnesium_polylepis.1
MADGGVCASCAQSCTACSRGADPNRCTSCIAVSSLPLLASGKCVGVDSCPDATFADEIRGACTPCESTCAACNGTASSCSSCASPLQLRGGSCV